MSQKHEPKFVVKYVESNKSDEEKKANYEKFLKYLAKLVREQEELDNNLKK